MTADLTTDTATARISPAGAWARAIASRPSMAVRGRGRRGFVRGGVIIGAVIEIEGMGGDGGWRRGMEEGDEKGGREGGNGWMDGRMVEEGEG